MVTIRVLVPLLIASVGASCRAAPTPVEVPVAAPPAAVVEQAAAPESEFVKLDLETAFGCALHHTGTVYCWGNDPSLALDMRERTREWTAASRVEGIPPIADIASTPFWSCGLLASGGVMCWGRDAQQIRDRVEIPIKDVVALSADSETCARTNAGAVYCWDFDTPNSPRYVFDDAIDLDVGMMASCALDSVGGIWCWDYDGPFEDFERRLLASKVAKAPGAVEIEVRDMGFCVRREDGEVSCVDDFEFGPVEFVRAPGLDRARTIAGALDHTCALLESGAVACFGSNGWAQLGDGSSAVRERAVTVPSLGTAFAVEVSSSTSCAIDRDGVACWGTPMTEIFDVAPLEDGQPMTDAVSIETYRRLTCASDRAGALKCWGVGSGLGELADDPNGILGAAKPTPVEIAGFGQLRKLRDDCFLDDKGELVCGQFGLPLSFQSTASSPLRITYQASGVDDFATGLARCTIAKSKLRCGALRTDEEIAKLPKLRKPTAIEGSYSSFLVIHDKGKLSEFTIQRDEETRALTASAATRIGELAGVTALFGVDSLGGCAIAAKGEVWCWDAGRRGAGSSEPYLIEGLAPAVQGVRFGGGVCALQSDGRALCVKDPGDPPRQLKLPNIVELSGGPHHVCGRASDGTVTCIGENQHGELGVLPSTLMAEPTRIELVSSG